MCYINYTRKLTPHHHTLHYTPPHTMQQCVEADSNIEVGALVVVITPDAGSFSNAGSIPNPAPVAAAAPVAATPVAQSVQSQQGE